MSGRVGQATSTLPPHLREVCEILARGIVRQRRRSIAEIDDGVGGRGETSLHFTAHPSGHANPRETEDA